MKPLTLVVSLFFVVNCAIKPSATNEDRSHNDVSQFHTEPATRFDQQVNEISASGALVYALVSSVADPDYLRKSLIGGYCRIKNDASNIEVPCPNVSVVLSDSNGKELSRALTQGRRFSFPVERGKQYAISIDSPKLRMKPERLFPLVAGDEVYLTVSSTSNSPEK